VQWLAIENLLRVRLPGFLGGLENILLDFDNFGHRIYDDGEPRLTFVEGRSRLQGNSFPALTISRFRNGFASSNRQPPGCKPGVPESILALQPIMQ
jgi:hypothetical protein